MFSKLGLQMYTVRKYMEDNSAMDKTFERMAALGYTEAQTAGKESAEYARLAKNYGIDIIGTHFGYDNIINDIEGTIKLHETLGTTNVGIGAMPSAAMHDEENFFKFVDEFNKAAEIYARYGFKLTYHNHSFEFVRMSSGKSRMDYMYENFDKNNVSFVLDTCWVAHAGGDVGHWIEKLKGRIDILHLKDLKIVYTEETGWDTKQTYCEVGNGNLYWDRILKIANDAGIKHFVVEQDGDWLDGDPFKSIEFSKKYLDNYME